MTHKFEIEPGKNHLEFTVTCRGLTEALGGCLKFFNDKCSQDLLQTGQGSFTPTSLGIPV